MSPDFFDNKNKQQVREELWVSCFKNINKLLSERIRYKRELRYFCFPGENAIFLKYLKSKNFISEKTIIVGIEKKNALGIQIQVLLRNKLNLQKSYVIGGKKYQKLVLHDSQLNNKYPFDIINLDINGSYHSLNPNDLETIYIRALQHFLYKQFFNYEKYYFRMENFYLLVTSNLENVQIPPEILKKYNKNLTEYLKREILLHYKNLNHPFLDFYLNNKIEDEKDINIVSILSTALRIINQCSQSFTIKLDFRPYCYKGHIDTDKMVAMRFICRKIGTNPSENGLRLNVTTKNLKNAIDLIEITKFLPEPEE